jgi:hypothetical protein
MPDNFSSNPFRKCQTIRQAVLNDLTDPELMCYRSSGIFPTDADFTIFKKFVVKIGVNEKNIKYMSELFKRGIGVVKDSFGSEFNTFVISVFACGRLFHISTDYPLRSVNPGFVGNINLHSPISDSDFEQIFGRSERPGCSDIFSAVLTGGGLVIIDLNEFKRRDTPMPDAPVISVIRDDSNPLHQKDLNPHSTSKILSFLLKNSFPELRKCISELNIPEMLGPIIKVLDNVFSIPVEHTISLEFQSLVVRAIIMCLHRCFDHRMNLDTRSIRPNDVAMIIGSIMKCSVFPIKPYSSCLEVLETLYTHFKINDDSLVPMIMPFAHLMNLFISTRLADLKCIVSICDIESIMNALRSGVNVISCAITIMSMIDGTNMKQSPKLAIRLVISLLKGTKNRLHELISLFELKKSTYLESEDKKLMQVGHVMKDRSDGDVKIAYFNIANEIIENMLLGKSDIRTNILMLEKFITDNVGCFIPYTSTYLFSRGSGGDRGDGQSLHNASMLCEHLKKRSEPFNDLQRLLLDVSTELDSCLIVLEFLTLINMSFLNTVGVAKKKTTRCMCYQVLNSCNKQPVRNQNLVVLGDQLFLKRELISSSNFALNSIQQIPKFYLLLLELMLKCGFLRPGQCMTPNEVSNVHCVSRDSVSSLLTAVAEFAKKYCIVLPADFNFDKLIAEIKHKIAPLSNRKTEILDKLLLLIRPFMHLCKVT